MAVIPNKAKICVCNQTGYTIDILKVIHRCKGIKDKEMECNNINNGSKTDSFEVEYYGRSWWRIEWRGNGLHCIINPRNFRRPVELALDLSHEIPFMVGKVIKIFRKMLFLLLDLKDINCKT